MTYVKVEDGSVSEFPYSIYQLKDDNPQVSFPEIVTDEILASYNVYPVQPVPIPAFDTLVEKLIRGNPTLSGTQWVETYTTSNIDEHMAKRNVREERDRLLSETDWWASSDLTMTQAQTDYRQALRDVPSQSGFPYSVTWPTQP